MIHTPGTRFDVAICTDSLNETGYKFHGPITKNEEDGNAILVHLAPTAPHECDMPDCPGNANRRKLEAFDELLESSKDAEIQMDLAAELLETLDDVWANEKAKQLETAAANIRTAIAKAEAKETDEPGL
jgi:hypothetical protein